MATQNCCICGASLSPAFSLTLLAKYDVGYFHCAACGFARTEEPYWLDEAYSNAISITDTGILLRNWALASKLACALYFCLRLNGTFIDAAGGYGIMTRLMRDYGFDYYWEDKYCSNLFAKGFESTPDQPNVAALSAFEVLEHAVDPAAFVSDLMTRHHCRTLVFSTETYSGAGPPKPDWWYLSTASGQHISFFQLRTLQQLAQRLGVTLYSAQGLHIFTDRKLHNAWLFRRLRGTCSSVLARVVRSRQGSMVDIDHSLLSAKLGGGILQGRQG